MEPILGFLEQGWVDSRLGHNSSSNEPRFEALQIGEMEGEAEEEEAVAAAVQEEGGGEDEEEVNPGALFDGVSLCVVCV